MLSASAVVQNASAAHLWHNLFGAVAFPPFLEVQLVSAAPVVNLNSVTIYTFGDPWPGTYGYAGIIFVIARVISDATVIIFSSGVAFFCSARAKSEGRALVFGFASTCGSILLTCGLFVAVHLVSEKIDGDIFMAGCVLVMVGIMGTQLLIAIKLIGRVARNFDAWALGEKPER
jgi:hypothetical protein